MTWPRIRQFILIAILIALSLAGLLFLLEQAPVTWQAKLAPSYLPYWAFATERFQVEESGATIHRDAIVEYEFLLAQASIDEPWLYSESREQVVHINFVQAELMRHQRELGDLDRVRKFPAPPSFLRYLWENRILRSQEPER